MPALGFWERQAMTCSVLTLRVGADEAGGNCSLSFSIAHGAHLSQSHGLAICCIALFNVTLRLQMCAVAARLDCAHPQSGR